MNTSSDPHITEDVLEEYGLGQTSEPDSITLEEHLLICPVCQNRLAEIDEYIYAAKAAAESIKRKPSKRDSDLYGGFARDSRKPETIEMT